MTFALVFLLEVISAAIATALLVIFVIVITPPGVKPVIPDLVVWFSCVVVTFNVLLAIAESKHGGDINS